MKTKHQKRRYILGSLLALAALVPASSYISSATRLASQQENPAVTEIGWGNRGGGWGASRWGGGRGGYRPFNYGGYSSNFRGYNNPNYYRPNYYNYGGSQGYYNSYPGYYNNNFFR